MKLDTLWWYRQKKRNTPPVITSSAPAAPAYGVAYSHTYTATGTAPITWSVTAGALPDGLSLDSGTGVLSGTPTASGAFSWTVTATNTAGTADQAATATVTYLSKALSFSPIALYSLIGSSNPANDLSGNGWHGTVNGATPAGGADVPFPEGGKAMLFDGNDNINIYHAALAAQISGDGTLTVMAWLKVSAGVWTDNVNRCIVNLRLTVSFRFDLWKLEAAYNNDLGALANDVSNLSRADTTSTEWICLIGEFNAGTVIAYLNGVAQTPDAYTATAWNPTSMLIGSYFASAFPFAGSLAYVGIFPLLSAAQVAILATA